MELGRAGRHHQTIQSKFSYIFRDIPLPRLGAGVKMITADRDSRQIPGLLRQSLRADHTGDIVAAVVM
jgi:hypothetical protein